MAPDASNQIHDFNLGIAPDGLFWTAPLGANSLTVNPGNGQASLRVTDLAAFDYFTGANALSRGAFEPAVVSFELNWARGLKKVKIRDQVNGFALDGVLNSATMSWTATAAGETYQSAPKQTSFSLFAEVGHERNGLFFPQGD